MKIILSLFLALLISPIAPAQSQPEAYKIGEYEKIGGGCEEYSRIADFGRKIIQQKGSRGLIVVYSGDNRQRFGNVLAYISGVKSYFAERRMPPEKISFLIAEGKNLFNEEFWIIPENAEFPDIKPFSFDWSKLQAKYHFSTACFRCEPSYPELIDSQPGLAEYAEILKKYPKYKGLIVVNNYAELAEVRNTLVGNLKLPRRRLTITVRPKKAENSWSVDFYIVPQATVTKTTSAKLSTPKPKN